MLYALAQIVPQILFGLLSLAAPVLCFVKAANKNKERKIRRRWLVIGVILVLRLIIPPVVIIGGIMSVGR